MTEPQKYRKKPVVIEAMQFDGTNVDPLLDWMIESGYMGDAGGHGPDDGYEDEGEFHIGTLEGRMTANPGDYIIRGVQGEFYPCKPHIFDETYEPA